MANVKITDLAALTNPASTDVLPIVDVGADVTKKISIADLLENAGSGTASAPGIAFDGDSNTGIYRPGADQLAISTNGTEHLRITSDGKLGLGTSSPGAGFHLTSAGQATAALDTTGDLNFILSDSGSNANDGGSLVFAANNGSWRFASIKGLVQNGGGNSRGDIAFSTRNTTADAALSEKMRITYDGLVGIGTTSPGGILHLNTSGATRFFIEGSDGKSEIRANNGNLSLFTNQGADANGANNTIFYRNGNNESMRIDSSGRLLIGTSSDSGGALLQVNGNRIRVGTAKTPASASDTGTAGEICWDSSYIYVCTATDTWKRAALSTW